MKLGPEKYHLNTFHMHPNEGSSELSTGRGIQKTIKIFHEINIISALTRPNNSLKKLRTSGFFYFHREPFGFTVERGNGGGGGWGERGGLNPIREVLLTSTNALNWYFCC